MKAQKFSRAVLAAAIAALTLNGMASVCHAESRITVSGKLATSEPHPPKTMLPAITPTLMIGTAMLEEYQGGNPADRTMILRDGATARQTTSGVASPRHA